MHRILAATSLIGNDHDQALYHQERGLALNPNSDLLVVQQGELLTWLGRPLEGVEWIKKAMRLNPYHPERFWNHLGRAWFVAERYPEALEAFGHITRPDQTHHAFRAALFGRLGDAAAAAGEVREVLRLEPGFRAEAYLETLHYRHAADALRHREALLAAGLPA